MPTMDIAARLIAADSRWDTVRGTFRAWRNGALTTQAFLEWNDIDMTTEGRHDG